MKRGVDLEFATWRRRLVTRVLPVLALGGSLVSCGGRSAAALIDDGTEASGDGDGDDARECRPECGPGERCTDGVCEAEPCSQYEERCLENRQEFCLVEQWVALGECPPGTTCVLDGSATYCSDEMDLVCPPGISWCGAEGDLLICNQEGRGFQTVSCAAVGAICLDGACVPTVCEPGTTFCRGNSIYACSENGASVLLVEDCGPGLECFSEPSVHCDELICEPSDLGCSEGDVVRCSQDGTDWDLVDSCSANEFCLEGEAACQPQLCLPGALFCVGNATAQCNSNGSGYVTGMDCGSEICAGGMCGAGFLYFEDFEAPSLNGWIDSGFGYEYSTTNLTFAGGAYSVTLSGGRNSHYDGIYHQFSSALTPARVTYWARQDTPGAGTYFTLHDTDSGPALENEVLFIYFKDDASLAVGSPEGGTAVTSWQPGVWYEISVTIDWPNHEFDIYVDGVLHLTDNPFRGGTGANQVGRISLYHYEDSVGYWDSITFE